MGSSTDEVRPEDHAALLSCLFARMLADLVVVPMNEKVACPDVERISARVAYKLRFTSCLTPSNIAIRIVVVGLCGG